MAKKKKPEDSDGLTIEDVLISVIIALAVSLVLFIVILVVGFRLSPGSFQRPVASTPSAASQPARVPSQAPTQAETPPQETSATPTPTALTQAPASGQGGDTTSNGDGTYTHDFSGGRVLVTTGSDNSGDPVYHTEDCRAAKTISPENEYWYTSEQDAINDGRRICGYCD